MSKIWTKKRLCLIFDLDRKASAKQQNTKELFNSSYINKQSIRTI